MIGQYTCRVTIQRNTPSTSPSGAVTNSWSDLAQRWAKPPVFRGGREFYSLFQQSSETEAVWEMTGYLNVTAKMRLVFDGIRYDILDVRGEHGKAPARATHLTLLCKAGQSA
jgi:SPP1 family predicted phage head-tail adaptor